MATQAGETGQKEQQCARMCLKWNELRGQALGKEPEGNGGGGLGHVTM